MGVDEFINSSTTQEKVYESDQESTHSSPSDNDDTDVTDLESTLRVMTRKNSSKKLIG